MFLSFCWIYSEIFNKYSSHQLFFCSIRKKKQSKIVSFPYGTLRTKRAFLNRCHTSKIDLLMWLTSSIQPFTRNKTEQWNPHFIITIYVHDINGKLCSIGDVGCWIYFKKLCAFFAFCGFSVCSWLWILKSLAMRSNNQFGRTEKKRITSRF